MKKKKNTGKRKRENTSEDQPYTSFHRPIQQTYIAGLPQSTFVTNTMFLFTIHVHVHNLLYKQCDSPGFQSILNKELSRH